MSILIFRIIILQATSLLPHIYIQGVFCTAHTIKYTQKFNQIHTKYVHNLAKIQTKKPATNRLRWRYEHKYKVDSTAQGRDYKNKRLQLSMQGIAHMISTSRLILAKEWTT